MPAPGPATAETLRDLLDLLLPGGCLGCGRRIPPGRSDPRICEVCRSRLRALPAPACPRCQAPRGTGSTPARACPECDGWPPELAWVRSAVSLEPPADRLVHALKYDGWREVGELMADRMAELRPPGGAGWDDAVLVPVPTTRGRRRRRGYNQAGVLAEGLARRLDLTLAKALRRRGGERTQVVLHPAQRRANVRAAFAGRPAVPPVLAGRAVVLVDDVFTTGATACAAAGALAALGADRVGVVTFARALAYRTVNRA